MRMRTAGVEEIDDDLFSLACGPDFRVKKYSSCIVNGVRFNTVDREKNKRTQNCGIMAQGTSNVDFYGVLKEIIQLEYNGDERSVVLFKCDWFKLEGKRTRMKNDGYFTSINIQNMWYKNDSLILATQARKVFYIPDTKYGENWQIVQTFGHRHLYNISEIEAPAYQDDNCCEDVRMRKGVSDSACEQPSTGGDETEDNVFDAAEFASLATEQTTEVLGDSEDEVDDTLMAYCSGSEADQDVDSDDD